MRRGLGPQGPVYTVECSTIHGMGRGCQTVNGVLCVPFDREVAGAGTARAGAGEAGPVPDEMCTIWLRRAVVRG